MVAFKTKLVALLASSFPIALAAPTPSTANAANLEGRAAELSSDAPAFYSGPWNNFPAINTWLSFDDMLNANKPSILATGSTSDDVDRISVAIQ